MNRFGLHKTFIIRQVTRSPHQSLLFVLCVILAVVTHVALSSFGESVRRSMLRDARALHSGDIIVRSHAPLSQGLEAAVARLREEGVVETARVREFYSVVRTEGEAASLLAKIKVVEESYPFYGIVELESGRPFDAVLTPGHVVVERGLLDRLGVAVGGSLSVGRATLAVADVVLREPDRPVILFALGPRVFVAEADLDALDLVKTGSRVEHKLLLKVRDPARLDTVLKTLRAAAVKDMEKVETFRTAESGIKRFFDNFLFFLSLIGIFTLLLAGVGIGGTLHAFLREKEKTIAILKALGADAGFVARQFAVVAGALGAAGTAAGVGLGLALGRAFPRLFEGLFPQGVEAVVSWRGISEGLLLGAMVVAVFTFVPLQGMKSVKPAVLLRREEVPSSGLKSPALALFVLFALFVGIALWELEDDRIGFPFVLGTSALAGASWAATGGVLWGLRRARIRSLALRQALRGLFRPRSATHTVMLTLTASLSVIFSITLLQQNMDDSFVRSYPQETPNLFFLDIQPSQREAFAQALGREAVYHPVVRGRIIAVNGEPVDSETELKRRGDNLAREFSFTYRDSLLDDERIIAGKALFRDDWDGPQVSVLDEINKMRPVAVGDRITFKIQGIPLDARVSSLRARESEFISPYFYFVFPREVLLAAPQTFFTAVHIPREEISALQTRMVAQFPNVSVVDMTETMALFGGTIDRLARITRFFTLFSVIAGVLLIVSSVLATRHARVQEAVYYKILGARNAFVLRVFTLENIVLGAVSALLACGLAQAASWIITREILHIAYRPLFLTSLMLMAATVLLVVAVGGAASFPVLRQKPVIFLREGDDQE